MDLAEIFYNAIHFLKANPLVAAVIAILVIFWIYRNPKFFISVLVIALLLTAIIYIVLTIASSGVSEKDKLIRKGPDQIQKAD